MKMDKENQETLNVQLSSDEKEKASNIGSTSSKQLYVRVRRRRAKRQYRRNQDAINFLRRFTLGVVIIDLVSVTLLLCIVCLQSFKRSLYRIMYQNM